MIGTNDGVLADESAAASRRVGDVERVLYRTGDVEDCVVLRRPWSGVVVNVAYVVPRPHVPFSADRLRQAVLASTSRDAVPAEWVELRSVPLTADGQVNEQVLLGLTVIESALVQRWEERLRVLPGMRDVAVVAEERRGRPKAVHLSDLLGDWDALSGEGTATSSDAAGGHTAVEDLPLALADGGALELPAAAARTLTDGLLQTADVRGTSRIRFIRPDGTEAVLTYAELLASARRVLAGLRRIGLRAGDMAILQLPDLGLHFPTFWACLLGGIKPVTVAVPPSYDARNAVARKLANTWKLLERPPVLAAAALVDGIRSLETSLEMDGVRIVAVEDLRLDPPAFDHHQSRPEDVAFFQLSSGSTGISKCIQITHGGVVDHIHASQQHLGLSGHDVTLNWLPTDHVVPLLMYHVKDTYLGIEQIQVPGSMVLGDPLKWLDLMDRYRVTHTWAPNFGYKMLGDALASAHGRTWDLSCVKGFLNAGEQVTLPVVREFLERVAPFGVRAEAMQPAFGMAEVCTCMTYNDRFSLETSVHRLAKASLHGTLRRAGDGEPAVTFIDCGPVVRGVQMRIADRTNTVVPERTIGRLQIKGRVVTPGYLNNPVANEETFVGDGWMNTGDLGFMWNGGLTITGREKELIIINGANFYCYEIEDIAAEVAGVLPTFSAACGVADPATGTEALALFFVHDDASGVDRLDVVRNLRTEVAARAGLSPAFIVPLARDEFPKTTSGKIQRNQLKLWLLEGRYRELLKELDVQLENANTLPDWFYTTVWRRRDTQPDADAPAPGARLVLGAHDGVGRALCGIWQQDGRICIGVTPGPSFRQLSATQFEIDPSRPEHYEQLLRAAAAVAGRFDQVVHLWTCDADSGDGGDRTVSAPAMVPDIDDALRPGPYSVLALVQAIAAVQPDTPTRLMVVSSGAFRVQQGDRVVAARAAMRGLVRTVSTELSWLTCQQLDLEAAPAAANADLVAREAAAAAGERTVAFRNGERWVSRIERLDMRSLPASPAAFVAGGVYLLTGGLGGVGTEVARHLLQHYGAHVLIVGRTAPEVVREGTTLSELERLPGAVRYEQVDVADAAGIDGVLDRACAGWGRALDGIIHMAGVFTERPIVDETVDSFAATLRPKVHGAAALERIVRSRPGVLFVTFSSAYGELGGFAAAAYSTANAFLDGLVQADRGAGGRRSYSLAWSLWNETGMSRGYGHAEAARARGFRLMSRRQGINSLMAALHRDAPCLLIGLDESGRAIRSLVDTADPGAQQLVAYCVADPGVEPLVQGVAVHDRFGHVSRCEVRRVPSLFRTASGDVDIRAVTAGGPGGAAPQVRPRSELEQVVAAVWQEALKQDGLSVHDNFFELGGTSFLAGQIAGRLRDALKADVVSTQMFQFPTIAAQAAFLSGDSGTHGPAFADRQQRGAARRDAARRTRRPSTRPSST